MEIIVVILLILCTVLLFLYIQLKKELVSLHNQLTYTKEEGSTFTLFTSSNDRVIEKIAHEVNHIKDEMQKEVHNHLNSEKEIRDMIANISHDIRTPLTSIQGYLEMMQCSIDPEERSRYYTIIRNRLDDLESMLDEFFLYTKLKNTKEEYILEAAELYPLVCSCCLNYMDILKEHDLEPQILCENEQIKAKIHEDAVRRICTNLIINTVRYGVKPFTITIAQERNDIRIIFRNSVKDSDVDVEHMFDRFYKGSEARTQKGSGLGLAIVKELSERMHGSVQAFIKKDVLSISVTLPADSFEH